MPGSSKFRNKYLSAGVSSAMRIFLFLFCCFFLSCNNDAGPDVSYIKVDTRISRFEKDFFSLDSSNMQAGLQKLSADYPLFAPFFLRNIMQVPVGSADFMAMMEAYRPINDSIQKKYGNLTWLQEELEVPFRYAKHYFPQYTLPKPVTFIGTFDAPGAVMIPGHLGIGLHQFAGKNFSVYKDAQLQELYPDYISRRFDAEYILPVCAKAIADDIYPDSSVGRPLIEQMIEKGKQWFLVKRFLPETEDSLITGYTGKQTDWIEDNEGNAWAYFSNNTDIYTTDPIVVQDYIGEGPFTRGMPPGYAPGNLGQWLGWRIVETYAEKKKMSVQEVLKTNARTIFSESKYKPK